MSEPEISFSSGRHQIKFKGNEAIREGGWSIRFLLVARGVAIVLGTGAAGVAVAALARWLLS